MASIKTWIVTTMGGPDRNIEGVHVNGESGQTVYVDAHQLTIEPSGALSFWFVTPDNMQAVLGFAFGPHEWKRVVINGPKTSNDAQT